MADRRSDDAQPLVTSTTSTTTTSGPHTTTDTSYSAGPGATVTTHGPNSTTITHPTVTTTTQTPQSPSETPQTHTSISGSEPQRRQFEPPTPHPQVPAPTLQTIPQNATISPRPAPVTDSSWEGQGNRRRSSSEPQRPSIAVLDAEHNLRRHGTATTPLQPLYEMASQSQTNVGAGPPPTSRRMRPGMSKMGSAINLRRRDHKQTNHAVDNNMVDVLDVIGESLHRCCYETLLIRNRPRGFYFDHLEQHAELTFPAQRTLAFQPSADLRYYAISLRIVGRGDGFSARRSCRSH